MSFTSRQSIQTELDATLEYEAMLRSELARMDARDTELRQCHHVSNPIDHKPTQSLTGLDGSALDSEHNMSEGFDVLEQTGGF